MISSLALWLAFKPDLKCYTSWLWGSFIPHFGGDPSAFIMVPDEGASHHARQSAAPDRPPRTTCTRRATCICTTLAPRSYLAGTWAGRSCPRDASQLFRNRLRSPYPFCRGLSSPLDGLARGARRLVRARSAPRRGAAVPATRCDLPRARRPAIHQLVFGAGNRRPPLGSSAGRGRGVGSIHSALRVTAERRAADGARNSETKITTTNFASRAERDLFLALAAARREGFAAQRSAS